MIDYYLQELISIYLNTCNFAQKKLSNDNRLEYVLNNAKQNLIDEYGNYRKFCHTNLTQIEIKRINKKVRFELIKNNDKY